MTRASPVRFNGYEDDTAPPADASGSSTIHDALRWALEEHEDSAMASADWLVRDIDPNRASAVGLLTDNQVTLEQLKLAKDAFKTMRIVGETPADRSLASRLYLGAIAAAMVRYETRITRQSDRALLRGLDSMRRDAGMARQLRDLAGQALVWMRRQAANAG